MVTESGCGETLAAHAGPAHSNIRAARQRRTVQPPVSTVNVNIVSPLAGTGTSHDSVDASMRLLARLSVSTLPSRCKPLWRSSTLTGVLCALRNVYDIE